jgi:hypothetical protein
MIGRRSKKIVNCDGKCLPITIAGEAVVPKKKDFSEDWL